MEAMADQALHHWAPRLGRVAVALAAAAVAAGAMVALAIVSFELNPAGPVLVVLAGLVAGGFAAHEVSDWLPRALGYGLVTGSLLTVLFWPFFDVSG
jgi:hypothetical protein